jgi:hypothetical protein
MCPRILAPHVRPAVVLSPLVAAPVGLAPLPRVRFAPPPRVASALRPTSPIPLPVLVAPLLRVITLFIAPPVVPKVPPAVTYPQRTGKPRQRLRHTNTAAKKANDRYRRRTQHSESS